MNFIDASNEIMDPTIAFARYVRGDDIVLINPMTGIPWDEIPEPSVLLAHYIMSHEFFMAFNIPLPEIERETDGMTDRMFEKLRNMRKEALRNHFNHSQRYLIDEQRVKLQRKIVAVINVYKERSARLSDADGVIRLRKYKLQRIVYSHYNGNIELSQIDLKHATYQLQRYEEWDARVTDGILEEEECI